MLLHEQSKSSRGRRCLRGKDEAARAKLKELMAKLAWSDEFVGRFIYATATAKELIAVEGVKIESGLAVIRPDKFGQKGSVLAQTNSEQFGETLRKALSDFKPDAKTFQSHVREGQRQGVFWETQIPVTDPMERAARERGKKANSPKN